MKKIIEEKNAENLEKLFNELKQYTIITENNELRIKEREEIKVNQ